MDVEAPAPWARMAVISTSPGGIVSGMGWLVRSRAHWTLFFGNAAARRIDGGSATPEPE